MKIVLASGSPRRAKILERLGVEFDIVKTGAPEAAYPGDPERTVRENALAKDLEGSGITVVTVGDAVNSGTIGNAVHDAYGKSLGIR